MLDEGCKLLFNDRVLLGVAWAQAGREYMQDAFSVCLGKTVKGSKIDFFGIFDGHGPNGENVAREAAAGLCPFVYRIFEEEEKCSLAQAIEMGCLLFDDHLREDPKLKNAEGKVLGGCTGCAVWVMGNLIYSGNVGDSRFILSYDGRAIPVTKDHKPKDPGERLRIHKAGGEVSKDDRVDGILGVSRSFGDFMFKMNSSLPAHEQRVTALPDVRTVEIDNSIDFLVVASDGIFDMLSNQRVVDIVVDGMREREPLHRIGEEIIEHCKTPINPLTGMGSDNMSLIITIFRED